MLQALAYDLQRFNVVTEGHAIICNGNVGNEVMRARKATGPCWGVRAYTAGTDTTLTLCCV